MVPGKIWWKNNKALIWYNLPRRCEIFINYYPECLTGFTDTNRWKQGVYSCKKTATHKANMEGNLGWKANNWWKILYFVRLPSKISLLVRFCGRTRWNFVSHMFQMLEKHHLLPLHGHLCSYCPSLSIIFQHFPGIWVITKIWVSLEDVRFSSIITLDAWQDLLIRTGGNRGFYMQKNSHTQSKYGGKFGMKS